MVSSIFVISNKRFSGKTAFCLGLALKLKEEGVKVGYFKPVGWRDTTVETKDRDCLVIAMQKALGLEDSIDDICPVIFDRRFLDEDQNIEEKLLKIQEKYEKVSNGKDFLIIEGAATYNRFLSLGISDIILAKMFNLNFLFITEHQDIHIIDETLFCKNLAEKNGISFLGCVVNNVSQQKFEKVTGVYKPMLINADVNVWGVIPCEILLHNPTVEHIKNRINGEVLAREDKLDNVCEDWLIGAMTQEAALRYFRRGVRKAVITGGDRSDIAVAALETDTAVLILTGGLYPPATVLALADAKGVPVILTRFTTRTAVKRLVGVHGRIDPGNERKISLAKELVEKYVDWDKLYTSLQ